MYFLACLLAINWATNQLIKMDKKFKITTLILGVIIAVLAFSNARLYAFPMEKEDITELKEIQIELLNLLEEKIETEKQIREAYVGFVNANSSLVGTPILNFLSSSFNAVTQLEIE
mgnify:CR=1 FL=1